MLTLIVNTLTVNDKHYLINRQNLTQPIQMHLSQKQKTFSQFFLRFQNLYQISNIRQKKMILVADVISKIPAPKNMLK